MGLPTIDSSRSPNNHEFCVSQMHGSTLVEIENTALHITRGRHTLGGQNYLSSPEKIDPVPFYW